MGLRDGISLFSVQRKVERMNSETRELAGQAVRKLQSGEVFSDEELRAGIEVLSAVVPCLREFGLMYHLPYSALSRSLDQLKGFRDARREDKIDSANGSFCYLNSWDPATSGDDWSQVKSLKELFKDIPSDLQILKRQKEEAIAVAEEIERAILEEIKRK